MLRVMMVMVMMMMMHTGSEDGISVAKHTDPGQLESHVPETKMQERRKTQSRILVAEIEQNGPFTIPMWRR